MTKSGIKNLGLTVGAKAVSPFFCLLLGSFSPTGLPHLVCEEVPSLTAI